MCRRWAVIVYKGQPPLLEGGKEFLPTDGLKVLGFSRVIYADNAEGTIDGAQRCRPTAVLLDPAANLIMISGSTKRHATKDVPGFFPVPLSERQSQRNLTIMLASCQLTATEDQL